MVVAAPSERSRLALLGCATAWQWRGRACVLCGNEAGCARLDHNFPFPLPVEEGFMHQSILIIASALAVAGAGVSVAACSSSSSGTPRETVDSGTNKGDTGSNASETGTATDTGTPTGDTGTALADSGPSPGVDGGKDSGSTSEGGSDAGTCSPNGMFQCPPPGAGCLSADAGGSGFVMCSLGQICVTTDECDLSA